MIERRPLKICLADESGEVLATWRSDDAAAMAVFDAALTMLKAAEDRDAAAGPRARLVEAISPTWVAEPES